MVSRTTSGHPGAKVTKGLAPAGRSIATIPLSAHLSGVPTVPYLHLPEQHTADDLVLAGHVAETFESGHLYVTWSHAEGGGARPTVRAVVRDAPANPLVEAVGILLAAFGAALRALRRGPARTGQVDPPSRERQAA